jgi:hypothetical protein
MVKIWTTLLFDRIVFQTKQTIATTNQIMAKTDHSLNQPDPIRVGH